MFSHVPPTQKLIGMGIAIVGIIVLSLAGWRRTVAEQPVRPRGGYQTPASAGGAAA